MHPNNKASVKQALQRTDGSRLTRDDKDQSLTRTDGVTTCVMCIFIIIWILEGALQVQ